MEEMGENNALLVIMSMIQSFPGDGSLIIFNDMDY